MKERREKYRMDVGASRNSASIATKLIRGVKGNVQIALRIGIADPALIEFRRSICLKCEVCQSCGIGLHLCHDKSCGCIIESKVQLKNERCPRGKWIVASSDRVKAATADAVETTNRESEVTVRPPIDGPSNPV
jgi:hypothetical protein